uniref:Pentacotripeptide-repeat region of PRORP domain-containing protein n=1 Tax=Sorghum bicolor TaxID=4558 RepID=C6JRV6_SORBI
MEASSSSYASAPAALLPLLAAPPRFLHLPLRRPSARRNGFAIWGGGGLLLQPPLLGPGSRARCRTTCCASSPEQAEVLLGGASLVSLAAVALLTTLQLIWLRWRSARQGDFPEIVHEHGKIIVNKTLGASKAMYDSNWATQLTQDSHWLSEPFVSGRVTVDEMHGKAGNFPCANSVHKETQAYSIITPWISMDTPLYISRPEEVSCSTSTANSSINKDTSLSVMPHSVSQGQDKSKCLSNRTGRVAGLPYQFLSLSGQKKEAQNSQGHNDKQMDTNTKDANLVGCPQSDQEEHLDFTSLSSFERVEEDHLNFVPQASYCNLLEPGKVIEFTNSNARSSYLPAGRFAPVACLREVRVSKQVKAVKGHDGGWNISNILNKENLDNFAPVKRGGLKGTKETLKDCMDLLESMEQNGLLDMKKVFHEMVGAGIEPNVNTYSALIDGCARAGQVAKAFGAYGIMSSKKVKPDRVVFNALISACGESGAVARAFDVLSEMTAESSESKGSKPIIPDHVTVGALMKTCIQACQMFLSALVDVAGHARRADAAFEIMKDARAKGLLVGTIAYSSLMGACCNAEDWKKALQLYEEIKSIKLTPSVSMMNALITSLCNVWSGSSEIDKTTNILKRKTIRGLQGKIKLHRGGGSLSVDETSVGQPWR